MNICLSAFQRYTRVFIGTYPRPAKCVRRFIQRILVEIPEINVWVCEPCEIRTSIRVVYVPSPALASHRPSLENVIAFTHELCIDNFLEYC